MDSEQIDIRQAASASLAVLVAMKGRLLRNTVSQAVRQHYGRIAAGMLVVTVLCGMLYVLLFVTLAWLQRKHLESILAVEYIFHFFFIAVMAMLWLSSSLLNYGGLFGKDEPAYLLVAPIQTWHFVSIKFVEAFVLSSWSLLLLGTPLLVAMARVYSLSAWFFPLFIVGFVSLAMIPSAWGLITAYVAARWIPRRTLTLVLVGAGLTVMALAVVVIYSEMTAGYVEQTNWLKDFYGKLRMARGTFLPSTWMSRLTLEAGQGNYRTAGFYLAILITNAVFFVWLAIRWVTWDFASALMRASEGSARRVHLKGVISAKLARVLFFWQPHAMRAMILKDLRCFLRDANQWSQMGVLVALLALYVMNLPRLNMRVLGEYAPVIVPFLNLAAVSLILATFTGRFIFPQVSLEAAHLWLVATMPHARGRIVISKFVSGLTVTWIAATAVVGASTWMLHMEIRWAIMQLVLAGAVCVGLCGMAVGMGAWLPTFEEKSAARIASGMGGMLNLIASVVWVGLVNAVNGLICRQAFSLEKVDIIVTATVGVAIVWVASIALAAGAMTAGIRSLSRRDL